MSSNLHVTSEMEWCSNLAKFSTFILVIFYKGPACQMKTLEVVNLQDKSEKKIIVMETKVYFFNFADLGEYSIQI